MTEPMLQFAWKRMDYDKLIKEYEKMGGRLTIRKALVLAADRAANMGITGIKRGIARDYTIPKDAIGPKMIWKYKAGSGLGMVIGVRLSDAVRPLIDFEVTPKEPARQPVVGEIKRGNKRFFKGAFVTTVGSKKKIRVFGRVPGKMMEKPYKFSPTRKKPYAGKGRQAIRERHGPSIVGMFKANEKVHTEAWDLIFSTLLKRFEYEFWRLVKNGANN